MKGDERFTAYAFPPYSYVTGHFPHPLRESAGHGCHGPEPPAEAFRPQDWRDSATYLWGIDLFNHGYYWEAHEVWESLWHSVPRVSETAAFLKGLIKLAAAGVKMREGRPEGIRRHARRAAELFRSIGIVPGLRRGGLEMDELIRLAQHIEGQAASYPADVQGMLDVQLVPVT